MCLRDSLCFLTILRDVNIGTCMWMRSCVLQRPQIAETNGAGCGRWYCNQTVEDRCLLMRPSHQWKQRSDDADVVMQGSPALPPAGLVTIQSVCVYLLRLEWVSDLLSPWESDRSLATHTHPPPPSPTLPEAVLLCGNVVSGTAVVWVCLQGW